MDLQQRLSDLELELTRLHEARELDRAVYLAEQTRLKKLIAEKDRQIDMQRSALSSDDNYRKDLELRAAELENILKQDKFIDFQMLEQGGVIHVLARSERGRLFAWKPLERSWKEFPPIPVEGAQDGT